MSQKAQAIHEATSYWEGGLSDGSGRITGSSSGQLAEVPVSWNARVGDDSTLTTPEELLAAAHSTCFSMALAAELQGRNASPKRLRVSAQVGFDPKVGGGFEVSFSHLKVKGDVPGISLEDFEKAVSDATDGCPISQALKGNVEITSESELA